MHRCLRLPLARAQALAAKPAATARALSVANVLHMRKALFSTQESSPFEGIPYIKKTGTKVVNEGEVDFYELDLKTAAKEVTEQRIKMYRQTGIDSAKFFEEQEQKRQEILAKYRDIGDQYQRIPYLHAALMRASYVFGASYIFSSLALMTTSILMFKAGMPLHELVHVELRQSADDFNVLFNAVETSTQMWKHKTVFSTAYTAVSMLSWHQDNYQALTQKKAPVAVDESTLPNESA